jgi:hypothetical protein
MSKIAFLLTLLVTALVCLLPAAPAHAQATRAFVSTAGSDSNNCINTTTPCRHFQIAYNAMPGGGEIDVLDPGNYGALTVTHTLSIVGRGWATLSPVSGSAAITINAGASDAINISGVALDGAHLANTAGIQFNSGASLSVQDSVIRNNTNYGILYVTGGTAPGQLSMANTLVTDNAAVGIAISPSGSGPIVGVLDHVTIKHNGSTGLNVISSTGAINITFTDGVCASNGDDGIASTSSGVATNIMVRNSTIANNGSNNNGSNAVNGLFATGTGALIWVTRSTITGNNTGWNTAIGGVVTSFADNNIIGNSNGNNPPPSPASYE